MHKAEEHSLRRILRCALVYEGDPYRDHSNYIRTVTHVKEDWLFTMVVPYSHVKRAERHEVTSNF